MPWVAAAAPYLAAAAAAATTYVAIDSAQQQKSQAKKAKKLAAEKFAVQKLQASAEAKQQRSVTARRLAMQLDAARVLEGASGATGGASQLVLESAYAADARNDLTTISENQSRANQSFGFQFRNNMIEFDSQTPNVGAAAFQGAAQGLGMGLSIYDGLGRLGGKGDSGVIGGNGNNSPDTEGGTYQR